MSVRVLLADDEQLVRAGFRLILESEPDFEVVGEAGNGAEAVELDEGARPRRRADGHPDARDERTGGHATDRRARPDGDRRAC